jgi:O-antigen/teichoic acid export membrane protein
VITAPGSNVTAPRDMARNAGFLAVARISTQAGSAVLFFAITRTLGFEQLGLYAAAISFFQIIAISGGAASTYLVREVARRPELTGRYLVHLNALALIGGGALAILGTGAIWLFKGDSPIMLPVAIAGIGVAPSIVATIQEGVFIAHGRTKLQAIISLVSAVAGIVCGLAVLLAGEGVSALLIVFVAIQILGLALGRVFIRRFIRPERAHFELETARQLAREMKVFLGSGLLSGLFARPEALVLALLSTPAQVGYYSAALKVVDVWQFVPSTIMQTAFPALSRAFAENRSQALSIQHHALRVLLLLSVPVGIGTLVLAPEIAALYGDAAGSSVDVLRILGLNLTLYSLVEVFWRVLSARGEQSRVLRIQAFTTVTRLASGCLLVTFFGAVGAAIATVANITLYLVLTGRAIERDGTRIGLGAVAWRPAIAATISAGAAFWSVEHLDVTVAVMIGLAVYLGVAWRLGAVGRADVNALRRRAPAVGFNGD